MSLFSAPKIKPDPAAKAAAARQRLVSDAQLTDALQGGLVTDTRARLRQFGIQPGTATYGSSFGQMPGAPTGGGAGFLQQTLQMFK